MIKWLGIYLHQTDGRSKPRNSDSNKNSTCDQPFMESYRPASPHQSPHRMTEGSMSMAPFLLFYLMACSWNIGVKERFTRISQPW
jgi:hypothetical protein